MKAARVSSTTEPALASRVDYDRAAAKLGGAWPRLRREHPELDSDDSVLLGLLLSKQPGRWIRQAIRAADPRKCEGLAEELGWARGRVVRSLQRLRAAGLVIVVLYTQADELPSGRHPRTNLCRYFVVVRAIDGRESEPSDGPDSDPSTGSGISRDPATPTPSRAAQSARRPRASRPDDAPPAPGNENSRSAPGPVDADADLALPGSRLDDAATGESERQQGGKEHEQCRDALCAAWNALAMPDAGGTVSVCRKSERTLLGKRLAEVGADVMRLAILGAGANAWLRRGRARTAAGFVFHDVGSVRRFAAEGEALERAGDAERATAERERQRQRQRDREAEQLEAEASTPEARRAAQDACAALLRGASMGASSGRARGLEEARLEAIAAAERLAQQWDGQ